MRLRYKQDLAKFVPISDGARLIQERTGITGNEAREDIVFVLQDGKAYFQFWRLGQDGRKWLHRRDLPHGFLDNVTPDDIDWETSIARRRRLGSSFTVEIEVLRDSLNRLWPDGSVVSPNNEDAKDAATVGRPSLRDRIEEVYLVLEEREEIDFNEPMTALYKPIRKKVREALGDPDLSKGLGDETIRSTIAPLFQAAKAKKQRTPT